MIKVFGCVLMFEQELKTIQHDLWYQGYVDSAGRVQMCNTNCRVAKCVKARPRHIKVKRIKDLA